MTSGQSVDGDDVAARDWPEFDLSPTYTAAFLPPSVAPGVEDVVIYDPTNARKSEGQWIAAGPDSHIPLPDCR